MKENLIRDKVNTLIKRCLDCKLQCRSGGVTGYGSLNAKVVLIGEAPDETEADCGIPFTGKSGQLLVSALSLFNITRESVYMTNIVKCRPPRNRQPEIIEMSACIKHLYNELYIIQPQTIVLLGATPLFAILNKQSITSNRGVWTMWNGLKVMTTFHPSYCLEGREGWQNHYELFIQDLAKMFS